MSANGKFASVDYAFILFVETTMDLIINRNLVTALLIEAFPNVTDNGMNEELQLARRSNKF
uniref:Uncharacterized protein n=1 Tax=Arundo donax TaxID=35708 RepID=A0A0A8YMB5_ARUDO